MHIRNKIQNTRVKSYLYRMIKDKEDKLDKNIEAQLKRTGIKLERKSYGLTSLIHKPFVVSWDIKMISF